MPTRNHDIQTVWVSSRLLIPSLYRLFFLGNFTLYHYYNTLILHWTWSVLTASKPAAAQTMPMAPEIHLATLKIIRIQTPHLNFEFKPLKSMLRIWERNERLYFEIDTENNERFTFQIDRVNNRLESTWKAEKVICI